MTKKELIENIRLKRSFLCVGLDPDPSKMPKDLIVQGPEAIFIFNKNIIDATAKHAVAYKPNMAFYEPFGDIGISIFERTCDYIRQNHPDIFVIADAKRGDIGNTSQKYAKAMFEGDNVDAVTVAPYMGKDSVSPFLDFPKKWTILLALTSNKGSEDFQMLDLANGKKLFEEVVEKSSRWGSDQNMMYVVGATRGELIKRVRDIVPNHFFLIPGVGAQGGSLEDVCRYAMNDDIGVIVNSSRGIIHASSEMDYATAAEMQANIIHDQMAEILDKRF